MMYTSAIQHPRWEEVVKYSHTKRVGAYLIGKSIGEGSFAKVKEALHCTVVEKVAVKIIDKKHIQRDPYLKKNLRREAKLLQLMRHPNIVKLYEVLETENYYYLAMELCSGGPLLNQLGKDRRMSEGEVRHYVRQIASAVGYMHQAGIIHRDLKVENLLLDRNNNIKIIDFGLSNLISNLKPVARENSGFCVYTGTQCGSPAYAAPEIIANRKYGPKVDVWSIGVNMFAMLSGTLPFVVEPFNLKLLLHRMLKGQMSEFPPNVSMECKSFILKLLEPNQVRRLSIHQVVRHEWLNRGYLGPLAIPPPAGRISRMDIDPDVTQYANEKLGLDIDHMTNSVVANKANHISAIYHLLLNKVESRSVCTASSRIPYSTKDFEERTTSTGNSDHSDVTGQTLAEEASNLQSNHLKRNSLHFKMALLAGIHRESSQPKGNSEEVTTETTTLAALSGTKESDKIEGKSGEGTKYSMEDTNDIVNGKLKKQFDEVVNLSENASHDTDKNSPITNENLNLDGKDVVKQTIKDSENNHISSSDNDHTTMDFSVFEKKKRKPKNKQITKRETENRLLEQREMHQRMARRNRRNIAKTTQANFSPTAGPAGNTYPQLQRRYSMGYNRRHSFIISKTCFSKRTMFYQKLPNLVPRGNPDIRPGSSRNGGHPADNRVVFQTEKRLFATSPVGVRPMNAHNSPTIANVTAKKRSSTQPFRTNKTSGNNIVGKILIDRKKMKSQIKVVLTDKTMIPRRVSIAARSRKHSIPPAIDSTRTTVTPLDAAEDVRSEVDDSQEVVVRPVADLQPPLISINNDRIVLRKLSAVL